MSTTTQAPPSELGTLILAWLRTRPDGKGRRGDLGKTFRTLLRQRWSEQEQTRHIDAEIEALKQAASIECPKRGSLHLTQSGRGALRAALEVEALPSKIDWRRFRQRYLSQTSLLPKEPGSKVDKAVATKLAAHHQLKLGDAPTLRQVRDALAWRAIGVETTDPFKVDAVLKVLLNKMLGAARSLDGSRLLEVEKVLEELTARAVEASPVATEESALTRLRRWLAGKEAPPGKKSLLDDKAPLQLVDTSPEPPADTPQEPGPTVAADNPDDDDAFAERVLAAARTSKTGRFGDKVFISHVFRRLVDEGAVVKDPDHFKARLVSAHVSGLLRLSRADMVETMEPEDVDASVTLHSGATFHFVRI